MINSISFKRASLYIAFIALSARLLFLIFFPDLDFPDSRAYLKMGNELFSNKVVTNDIYMPLYPIVTYLTGGGFFLKIFDISLSLAMIVLIYAISLEIFGDKKAALISGSIAALYPHIVFYSVSGLTEIMFTTFLLMAILLLYKKHFVPAFIVLALSILIRPSTDLFNPVLVFLFVFYIHKASIMKSLYYLLLYLFIYSLVMSPWWLYQYNKYGDFVRLNLGDGIVLFSGNNPLNTSGGGVGNGNKGKDDMDLSVFKDIVDPIEKNEQMKNEAYKYIFENPSQFIKMSLVKFERFWRLWPHTNKYQQWYTIIASISSYGIVLALSIFFIFKYFSFYRKKLIPILGLFLYLTLIHMVTIGSIRYRFPLEPFLIIFSGYIIAKLSFIRRFEIN